MIAWFTPLFLDAWSLVRVEDPDHPDAVARSETGAVLLAPPADGPYDEELVPEPLAVVATEARAALGTEGWHAAGHDGHGVRVAIFDVQFNGDLDPDELGDFTTHDCFAHPSCEVPIDAWNPTFAFEQGGHGIACAEVVHDVAPGAELALVRINGRTTLENAVAWAIREDVDVVSLSMAFLAGSFHDGSGPVSRVAHELAAAGVLLVVSSGNYAGSHWGGPWRDVDRDGRLDFDGSNGLDVWFDPGGPGVVLSWDQFGACGLTDLDVLVLADDGDVIGRGDAPQLPAARRCGPVERVRVSGPERALGRVEVHHVRGPTADLDVDLLSLRSRFATPRAEGSIADPASSPFAFTVGAVDATGYLHNPAEPFSSVGDRLRSPFKPDVAGPDGLSTTIYGSRGFFGTSASAPAVAGAAAVLLSREPELSPIEAGERLRAAAWADGPGATSVTSPIGSGRVRLGTPDSGGPGCLGGGAAALLWWPWVWAGRRRR